jgi:hypothetical protein
MISHTQKMRQLTLKLLNFIMYDALKGAAYNLNLSIA